MNQAILRMKPTIPTKVSSRHSIPNLSVQNGANLVSVDLKCALCDAQLNGRTKPRRLVMDTKVSSMLNAFLTTNVLLPPLKLFQEQWRKKVILKMALTLSPPTQDQSHLITISSLSNKISFHHVLTLHHDNVLQCLQS